ncbi:hypothetical protein [Actinopolymorpha alba]|uniref:hypothetical protein n=1 Tax=Actinopolymorpha alba TaxID=533267 RepID=UPI000372731E|nr:hypothetical protein [Actinopolymorpha alba]
MTYSGGKVKEPEQFLASVDNQWRNDLGGARVTRHKEARCYFSAPTESKELDSSVYCGPVRHFVDQIKSDSTSDDSSDSQSSEDSEDTKDRPGPGVCTDLPGSLQLLRPDGQKPPADGDKLVAPPPPPVEAGYLDPQAQVDIKGGTKPKDGRVITPRKTVTVEQVGTTDKVATDDGTKGPASGEKFVVATLSFAGGPFDQTYGGTWDSSDLVNADVSYALQVGSNRKPIKWQESYGNDGAAPKTIVASVPKDADPMLVVSAAGKDQTISLATGERKEEVAGFYRSKTEVGVSRQYASKQFTKGDFEMSVSLLFKDAQLTPFDPARGWAPDGKTWLVLGTEQVEFDWNSYKYSVFIDRAKTTTVKGDKGGSYRDLTPSDTKDSSSDDLSPIFEVDEKATKFDVTFAPTFTFSATSEYFTPRTGSGSLAKLEFALEF